MIIVHHLNNSRSQRVLWLLEELGIEYDIKFYERDSKTMLAPASLRQVHPLGKSPVITDAEVTVAESGAIIEYIVERYGNGQLIPKSGTPERLRYTYWLHYAEGSAMPPLVMNLIFNRFGAGDSGANDAFIAPQIELHFDYIEAELGKSTWFVGSEFTAADIQMSFPLELVVLQAELISSRPKIQEFIERIHARPAYKRALERGGKYDYANSI
ncbi:glutathione S-transferase family protein (plasmid) [Anabaena sp. FACHB-709]|uniref:glutathione transferase n=2 Tax=Nostocaceae TaxID=1162 RepID=A0A1Z4KV26_ANAVA|nr:MULTISPECIES: glutathione S-transferase [Nostocaceae]BAY72839.1 glutathione S-transferase [Trichormus variabilis NIES-23]MBD2175275.1 glutathione S-transferase [Anabaena cylindrica FACHB-318]MBD2267171.1 glutathione S-transferase [Anabaena sp. FACHB-709]MBD2276731.1 glutathione S-transferase [Nostoc sp. PCC 7120 = FACHB-418]MBD2287279.1 glutathione S-transferase [Anabaena cylindrica FACHB-170]